MTTNKERMLNMVLDDPKLQETYGYSKSDYEDFYSALNSEILVVRSVAMIIRTLDGKFDESNKKKTYLSVGNYIMENYVL